MVDSIRSSAVKKVLKLLADLAENDPGKYATFWKEFGAVLKEGVADDYSNRDEIARLLRFSSTTAGTRGRGRLAARLHRPDEGRPGEDLLPARPHAGRRGQQPAPGGVPQEGHRGAAARATRWTTGWSPACASSTAGGCSRSPRATAGFGALEDEAETAGQGTGQHRLRRADRPAEGRPGGHGPGRAGHQPAHHVTGLHRGQRARDRLQPDPPDAGLGRAEPAGAGDQPGAPAGAAAQPRPGRPAARRLGPRPLESGRAHARAPGSTTRPRSSASSTTCSWPWPAKPTSPPRARGPAAPARRAGRESPRNRSGRPSRSPKASPARPAAPRAPRRAGRRAAARSCG